MREYLRRQLNERNKKQVLTQINRVVKGWINYHGISDNQRRVKSFIRESRRAIYLWFRRMGGKRKMNWRRLLVILEEINFPSKWKTISMF
jgi:hypothetical protein